MITYEKIDDKLKKVTTTEEIFDIKILEEELATLEKELKEIEKEPEEILVPNDNKLFIVEIEDKINKIENLLSK